MSLIAHPRSDCPVASRVEIDIERPDAGSLILDYAVHGDLSRLRLPKPLPSRRADDLWQHSCFEMFLRQDGDVGYLEFNFAPSTEWAAYRFDAYRSGRTDVEIPAPRVSTSESGGSYHLRAALSGLPDGHWLIGLSAILEEESGCKSYWALSHPDRQPDFHHKDCFALELRSAG